MRYTLLLALCLLTMTVRSQWTSDTTVNTLVRDTLGATDPKISTNADGSSYISWFEQGVQGYELRMQLLDSNGVERWSHGGIVISNQPQNTALFRYDLKTDNTGNAIVAFQDERTSGALNIVAYKINNQGISVWGTNGVQLIDSESTEGLGPVIGIGANNYVYIAWNADSSSNKWISCQCISPNGVTQWNNLLRIKDPASVLKYSRPKLFPTGTSMQILYVEESGSFPAVTSTLYTERFDTAGIKQFPLPVKVSTKPIPYFFFPEPVPDDNGGFFVAFNTSNPVNPSLNDVYVQYADYNGALWNPAGIEAANSTNENKTTPSACYVSILNEFFVLLQVQDAGQSMSGVSVQRFDGGGGQILGANGLTIFPVSSDYYLPYTISDAGNGVILTCTNSAGGQNHIIAEKIDYNGLVSWPGVTASLCAVNSNKDDLQSGKFINNNVVFVWQDDRNGSGIFCQNINGDGQPGITAFVNEKNYVNNFKLFPNPSNNFKIEFKDRIKKIIEIFDSGSRLICSATCFESYYEFTASANLADGIYFIKIRTEDYSQTICWSKSER